MQHIHTYSSGGAWKGIKKRQILNLGVNFHEIMWPIQVTPQLLLYTNQDTLEVQSRGLGR
jgi:hypothetical protein